MGTWEELKAVVAELNDDPRRPVRGFVGAVGDQPPSPPCQLSLAAWAVEIAESIAARFGNEVSLTVGALHFPDRTLPDDRLRDQSAIERLPRLPDDVEVTLSVPLVVRSGFDERAEVEFHNHVGDELVIHTNGVLTARVVVPTSSEVVGGCHGWQTAPLVVFRCAPGGRVLVPLLVGTTSFVPALGYAIPPGACAVEAVVDLHGRGRYVTRRLLMTVTP